jgi:hypothetical protein
MNCGKYKIYSAIYINYENKCVKNGRFYDMTPKEAAEKALRFIRNDYKNSKYVGMDFPFLFGIYETSRGNKTRKIYWYEGEIITQFKDREPGDVKKETVEEKLKRAFSVYNVTKTQKISQQLLNFIEQKNVNKLKFIHANEDEY